MRRQRGVALVWAMLTMFIVAMASGVMVDSLLRRGRVIAQQRRAAAEADLLASGEAAARVRARDTSWTGPESIALHGGTVTFERDASDPTLVLIEARARLTDRRAQRTVDLARK